MASVCGPEEGEQRHPSGAASFFREFRERLADCRRRGLDFDEAWALALPQPRRGADSELLGTRGILQAQRAAWERAYLREPPEPRERAVAALAFAFFEEPGSPDERVALLG